MKEKTQHITNDTDFLAVIIGFGSLLHERRLQLEVSLQVLARRTQLSEEILEAIEQGRRDPSLKEVMIIARAIHQPAVDLMKQLQKHLDK